MIDLGMMKCLTRRWWFDRCMGVRVRAVVCSFAGLGFLRWDTHDPRWGRERIEGGGMRETDA
jgi:hypothetical protein